MTTTRRGLLAVLCVAICGVSPLAQSPGTSSLASDSEIQKILAERVDAYRQSVGVVVGVIERQAGASSHTVACLRTPRRHSTATHSSRSAR